MNTCKPYLRSWLLLAALVFTCTACVTESTHDNTPEGNFRALWEIIDRQYCFLDYKHEAYGLDWDEVYTRYHARLAPDMSSKELFRLLAEMLDELRDGHVNLSSKLETSQYRAWYDDYPANFNDSLQRVYLGKDYALSSGLKYKILEDNIGYIYCSTFESGIGEGNLDNILSELAICDGLILDVRNNGGGNLTLAERLAARFTNERVLTSYLTYKLGPGHSDFATPTAVYLDPAMDRVRWQKPVAVLTNRRAYSATNDFVNKMKQLPRAVIIGDRTGGGSGLPFSSELPNGWSIRFSACPVFDPDMQQLEFGIDPDIPTHITAEDWQRSRDTLIETARQYLKQQAGSTGSLPAE